MTLDPLLGVLFLAPLGVGVVVALLMSPLHRALATRRRQALLVDRVVTGRVARLTGPERRRAVRHLHREAGNPVATVLGLAVVSGVVTLVAALVVANAGLGAAQRRTTITGLVGALDDAGLPTPSSGSEIAVVAGIAAVLLALAVAALHVGALDVERRRSMPVTRPWPLSKRRTTWLVAAGLFLLLALIGLETGALAAGLFLLGHQLTVRATRPKACIDPPALPEALRAARLPGPKERRLIRSRRRPAPGMPGPSAPPNGART
ncbi:hypothetical protein, partial [Actinomycetospora atypica]